MRECIDGAASRCLLVPGAGVDAAIGQLLLDTLTPLALEVALTVQAEIEARADHADQLRRHNVERTRHRADLARRRYLAVDPDNRLVADSLEADWNDALRAVQAAQDDYQKATAAAAVALTDEHKARIRALTSDFPALWSNPATPQRERKRTIRLLVEDVTLAKTDQIHAHVRFRGGQTTSLTLPIPGKAWQLRETHTDTLAELDRLLDEHTDAETAAALNAAGHRSGEGKPFTGRIVLDLRRAHGMPSHLQRLRGHGMLTVDEIAHRLGVHPSTIKAWHRAGLLASHKANDKNVRLFEPPAPGDPRLAARQGSPIRNRVPTQPAPGGAV
jgi:DNA-binding transcriptional regulator YiaG